MRAVKQVILATLTLLAGIEEVRSQPKPPVRVSSSQGCIQIVHEHAPYTTCRFSLRDYELRLFLSDSAGQAYGSLPNLVRAPGVPRLAMAMNAGMYQVDLQPLGLFVAAGQEGRRLNLGSGEGNFYLKPNGVFLVEGGRAAILESRAYAGRRRRPNLATQSGPLLVAGGQLHPRISEEGPSRKLRNGVGVIDPSTVVFAISDEPVSFGAFARLFRDTLGARDALFLDGSISALHAPDLGRTDISLKPLGPIIGVVPR